MTAAATTEQQATRPSPQAVDLALADHLVADPNGTRTLLHHLALLAADVGRLRRRTEPDSSLHHLAARLADRVDSIDAIVHPSAASLYRDYYNECGDHELALREAVRTVDARAGKLRQLLEEPAR